MLLLLLLLYVPYHVHLGGREAPPLDFHSKVLRRGLGQTRPRALLAWLPFAPSCALLRSTSSKICALLGALRSGSVFALELGRWASILFARTVPGPRFALPERPFACSHAARARLTRTSSNFVKTSLKLSRNACRPLCAKRRSR